MIPPDGILEPLVRFRPDLVDVGRACLGQFRVFAQDSRPSGKLEGFELLIPAQIPPEAHQPINHVGRARLVLDPARLSSSRASSSGILITLGRGSSEWYLHYQIRETP